MRLPKQLSRKTNHKPPRCQLYQPGFNESNGCWLYGDWVTVSAEGFAERAREHGRLYRSLRREMRAQHHDNPPVSRKDMTLAQLQAWKHFSGERVFSVRYENGLIGPVSIRMAGDMARPDQVKWLRSRGAKVIPKTLEPNGQTRRGKRKVKVENQAKFFPADVLSDDVEPVDAWKHMVRQNQDRSESFGEDMAKAAMDGTADFAGGSDFMKGVAVQPLLTLEQQIVSHRDEDPFETLDEIRTRYVRLRRKIAEVLGDEFDSAYEAAKRTHNECERTNLDNSDGRLFCYVLPKFNADGTHDPLGPRDFPWNRT